MVALVILCTLEAGQLRRKMVIRRRVNHNLEVDPNRGKDQTSIGLVQKEGIIGMIVQLSRKGLNIQVTEKLTW